MAAVLTEPALTNIGIVLPEPGFLEGVRELATRYGALLMIDETHTFSAGWGGATPRVGPGAGHPRHRQVDRRRDPVRRLRHQPREVADAVTRHTEAGDADIVDVGGVGGTLAGNALSTAAMRATLGEVLTPRTRSPT